MLAHRFGLRSRSWCIILLAGLALSILPAGGSGQELRTWSDNTGRYTIRAKFLSVTDGKVTLQREDGSKVQVELARLSAADQQYVRRLQAETDNPFKPVPESPFRPVPPAEPATPEEITAGATVPDWTGVPMVSVTPTSPGWRLSMDTEAIQPWEGPLPAIPLPPRTDAFEKAKALVVNPVCRRAVVGYVYRRPGQPARTRIVICDLAAGRTVHVGPAAGAMLPLALADDGVHVLMRPDEIHPGKQDRLELWAVGSEGNISKGLKWIPHGDRQSTARDIKWAAFVDSQRLLTLGGEGQLALWNASTAQPIWWLKIDSRCRPALSPDRKLLAFASGKQLGVLDIEAGTVVAAQPAPQPLSGALFAFTADGKRLAAARGNKLYVWESATGRLEQDIFMTGAYAMDCLVFPSPDYMLVQRQWLFHLPSQLRVWRYAGHELVTMLGDVCWFLVFDGFQGPGALVPARIPHPDIQQQVEEAVSDPDLLVLKPGVTVRLDVSGVEDAQRRKEVHDWLAEKLRQRGFRVGDQGTVELRASVESAGREKIAYRRLGRIPPYPDTYKVRRFVCKLEFVYQGKTLWEIESENILPFLIRLKKGETVQKRLKEHEKPNYAFFQYTELPKLLARPSNGPTLGSSQVTIAGIQ